MKIARNIKGRFPDLFKGPFNKNTFNVISTNTSRTIASASAFFDAAIGRKERENVLVVAGGKEQKILRVKCIHVAKISNFLNLIIVLL